MTYPKSSEFQKRAFFAEFPWLRNVVFEGDRGAYVNNPDKVESVAVARVTRELLDSKPERDGATGNLVDIDDEERFFLVAADGALLATVQQKIYIRHNEAHTDDTSEEGEAIGEALARIPDPGAVAFVVKRAWGYEIENHHSVGGNAVVIYKPPKGFTLKSWVEEMEAQAAAELRLEAAMIDSEAAYRAAGSTVLHFGLGKIAVCTARATDSPSSVDDEICFVLQASPREIGADCGLRGQSTEDHAVPVRMVFDSVASLDVVVDVMQRLRAGMAESKLGGDPAIVDGQPRIYPEPHQLPAQASPREVAASYLRLAHTRLYETATGSHVDRFVAAYNCSRHLAGALAHADGRGPLDFTGFPEGKLNAGDPRLHTPGFWEAR